MWWLVFKYATTAAVVVVVSEVAKRSDRIGGLLAALPLMTVLTLIWLYVEGQPEHKIANHAWYTLWYVLPTLPMFAAFPWLLQHYGFWLALALSAIMTTFCFVLTAIMLKPFGILLI